MMKVGVLLLLSFVGVFSKGLKEEFTWSRINYVYPTTARFGYYGSHHGGSGPSLPDKIVFPSTDEESSANTNTNTGPNTNVGSNTNNLGDLYIHENNIPMGANRWHDKLFVTVPRRRAGVPSSLNYVWVNSTERHNVPLIPYPNWEINQLPRAGENDHLVSVYRTAVDACDRLWMVDTGLIEIPDNNTRIQPPSIVIIDLHTDKVIRRYTLKSSDYVPVSTLASLVIDVTDTTCDNAYAYIPDLSGYGVIVYSFHENDSWRVNHNYFYLEALAGEFNVGGVQFQWNDGVFSLGLSKVNADGFRNVYFHSMAGTHIYSVSTRILRNKDLATRSHHQNDFKIELDRGDGSQTSASDLHKPTGLLFLALVNQNALGCWNTNTAPRLENFDVIHRDDQKFIYPSDVKVYRDEVIVLTNTMPVFLYRQLNYDQVNFRVWIENVNEAVKNTACATNKKPPRRHY